MPEITPFRFRVDQDWSSVPHLDEKTKAELLASYPPHMRDARSQGIPALGIGAVWPIAPDDFMVTPFKIPDFWPRGYALDVGWNTTAALFAARDPDSDVIYAYNEYYAHKGLAVAHAAAIKTRGEWIPGCIDPASRAANQADGSRLLEDYQGAGLNLIVADNAVEAGVFEVFNRLSTGRLKVFSTLSNFWAEFRRYHRDEKGRIVKDFDHLMDCFRYIGLNHLSYFITQPVARHMGEGRRPVSKIAGI